MRWFGMGLVMCSRLERELSGAALDDTCRRRIADTLGVAPRDALEALVAYGMHDSEIARYHGLSRHLVAELREFWRIPPNP